MMERVTFLVEDTHERITALMNPASVVSRRNAVLRERRSLPTGQSSGFFDHGPVVTGGAVTEMELDLLFDTSLSGSNIESEDVRALTEPLWRLAEARTDSATSYLQLPRLRLIWGKAWNVPAVVVAVAERLEHFDASGAARRSWLRLRLRRVPERAEPSSPGVLPGTPPARAMPSIAAFVNSTEAFTKSATRTDTESNGAAGKTVAKLSDVVAGALTTGEAKELAEQASTALESAREAFATSGLAVSLDVSISTNSFTFEMSLALDLSALTPRAIASRVAGWLRWARDGLSSLGASAKRLGLAAVRRIKAGFESIANRMTTLCEHIGAELRNALTNVRESLEIAARRVAGLARVVMAEVHRRVVDGYRALAFATQKTAQWIGQHVSAILRATSRMATAIGDKIGKAAQVFLDATESIVDTIATTAHDAARLAGKTIRSGAKALGSVCEDVASSVRATLAAALRAARDAGDALLAHLREAAPEVLKWAKDALLRNIVALGQVAFAAAANLERAGHFVIESAASTLSRCLAKTKAWLAAHGPHLEVSLAWELTETASSDDIASNDESARAIRLRIGQISPKLGAFEQNPKNTDIAALGTELDALSSIVATEEAMHFERMVNVLERPSLRKPDRCIRLDLLAFEQGGDPRGWKLIAEANDIDDPLAVSAGTTLDLSFFTPRHSP